MDDVEQGPVQRLKPETTAVIVVDVQERLAAAMPEQQLKELLRALRIVLEGARLLNAPVLATEQYPKGLGPTVGEVLQLFGPLRVRPIEKTTFSAWDAPEFQTAFQKSGADAAVVLGMEAHVCVFQTVRDLLGRGISVQVPMDGVAARRDDHRETGLKLCERVGAVRTTSETVAFDWLARAGTDEFRALSRLIR